MKQKNQKAIIALIGANIVPLIGVLIFDWSIFSIMIAYWLENIVIGLYTIIKIMKSEAPNPPSITMNGLPLKDTAKGKLVSFFIFHFGGFALVHGIFVFVLFGVIAASDISSSKVVSNTDFSRLDVTFWGILIMFIAMLISHGVSYKTNYLEREEFKKVSPGEQMFKPYGRVMVMHVVIIGSGFLISMLGSGRIFASIVVIIKMILDYYLHTNEHFKIFEGGSMSSGTNTIYKRKD